MTNRAYTKAMNRIEKYLTDRGFTVNLNSNTFGFFEEEDLVTCASRAEGTLSMICGFLHEAGHAISAPSTFADLRPSNKRDRVMVAELEYKAWEEGWKLAKRLKITFPELEDQYRKDWMRFWNTYLDALYTQTKRSVIKEIAYNYTPESE